MRFRVKCIALLCLMVVLWSGVTVATHHHSSSNEAARCAVCIAAHSAAPTIATHLLTAFFLPLSTIQPEADSEQARFVAFALNVRPPPVAWTF